MAPPGMPATSCTPWRSSKRTAIAAPVSLSIVWLLRLVAGRESMEPQDAKPRSARAGGVIRIRSVWLDRSVPRARAIYYSYEDEYARDDDRERAGEGGDKAWRLRQAEHEKSRPRSEE